MKHLKTYKLFEFLRDDFKSDLKRVRSNYHLELDKIKKEVKEEVDNYMFDILDEYQKSNDSYININEIDDIFEVGYDNIEFNLSKSEEFLKITREVLEGIKFQLGLDFKFAGHATYSELADDFNFTSIDIVNLTQLERDIKSLKQDDIENITKYTIKLTIFVHFKPME